MKEDLMKRVIEDKHGQVKEKYFSKFLSSHLYQRFTLKNSNKIALS